MDDRELAQRPDATRALVREQARQLVQLRRGLRQGGAAGADTRRGGA